MIMNIDAFHHRYEDLMEKVAVVLDGELDDKKFDKTHKIVVLDDGTEAPMEQIQKVKRTLISNVALHLADKDGNIEYDMIIKEINKHIKNDKSFIGIERTIVEDLRKIFN